MLFVSRRRDKKFGVKFQGQYMRSFRGEKKLIEYMREKCEKVEYMREGRQTVCVWRRCALRLKYMRVLRW